MPIHDQGYQRYLGTRAPHGGAWMIIARQHIMSHVRKKVTIALLMGSWIPFLVLTVWVYLSTYQAAAMLQVTSTHYRTMLDIQWLFVFIISISMAGLIADDRRANALQVYLSKPLTRVEYVTGKLMALLAFLLAVTLLPALTLVIVQTLLTGSFDFIGKNLFLLPAIVLFALTESLLAASLLLALSSLSKSRRFVSVMFAGVIFFTVPMYEALRSITGSRAWAVISPSQMLDVIGDSVFRIQGIRPVPVAVAALVVIVLIGVSVWVLERRVRGIEVVA